MEYNIIEVINMESNKKVSVILPNELYNKVAEEEEKTGRGVSNWIREVAIKNTLRQEKDNG